MIDQFSSKSSALEYLYQIRYALLLLIMRKEKGNNVIEILNDFSWRQVNMPNNLLQLKHQMSRQEPFY